MHQVADLAARHHQRDKNMVFQPTRLEGCENNARLAKGWAFFMYATCSRYPELFGTGIG